MLWGKAERVGLFQPLEGTTERGFHGVHISGECMWCLKGASLFSMAIRQRQRTEIGTREHEEEFLLCAVTKHWNSWPERV